ncbi:hypothetical protein CMI41_02645 [Candidatus Pacearchaeota archaeon]|nr:hypothetical protein [Candidatus Pacearchaeota archaeon]|tara:strand:+ start:19541 stop:19750 length:210 start_codon:yes stop_codon:yes gene_type:complete
MTCPNYEAHKKVGLRCGIGFKHGTLSRYHIKKYCTTNIEYSDCPCLAEIGEDMGGELTEEQKAVESLNL